jgi:hypothetical protein
MITRPEFHGSGDWNSRPGGFALSEHRVQIVTRLMGDAALKFARIAGPNADSLKNSRSFLIDRDVHRNRNVAMAIVRTAAARQ